MLKQLKYSARQGLGLRIFALFAVLALNGFFAFTGSLDLLGEAGKITGVTLSSLALTGLIVISIIADVHSFRSVYSSPEGYVTLLTPVSAWKKLLGRIVPIVVFDLVSWAIGIAGIILQSYILSSVASPWFGSSDFEIILWYVLVIILNYLLLINLISFSCAVKKSLFYGMRLRKLLWLISFLTVFFIINLPDFILSVFLPMSRYGIFFTITIYPGFNAGMIGYLIICLIKSAVLLVATSYLVERKMNL